MVGLVPAGQYYLGTLYAWLNTSNMTYSAYAQLPPTLGIINVPEGKVTNIGTLYYHPLQAKTKFSYEISNYAVSRDINKDAVNLARKLMPQFKALQTGTILNAELPVPLKASNELTTAIIKKGAHLEKILLEESLYGVGKFGLVENIQTQEQYSGLNHNIADMILTKDTHYVIGEFGTFASRSLEEGAEFVNILGVATRLNGINIFHIDQRMLGLLYESEYHYHLYSYDRQTQELTLGLLVKKKPVAFLSGRQPGPVVYKRKSDSVVYLSGKQYTFNTELKNWDVVKSSDHIFHYMQKNGIEIRRKLGVFSYSPLEYKKTASSQWQMYPAHLDNGSDTYRTLDGTSIKIKAEGGIVNGRGGQHLRNHFLCRLM
jgi:hypothetical protein